MKIVSENKDSRLIEIGDLIKSKINGNIYYLAYQYSAYINGFVDKKEKEFKYMVLNLKTGLIDNSYSDKEIVNLNYTLLARNEDLKLKY